METLDLLDIHLSRDHGGSATELGASAGGPQMRTRSSTGAAEVATRNSVQQETHDKKGNQKVLFWKYFISPTTLFQKILNRTFYRSWPLMLAR